MSSEPDQERQVNKARRHFLGLSAAVSARLASVGTFALTVLPGTKARADGTKWWQVNCDPSCFLRGTAIMTPTGEVPVEDLRIGDRVETVRGRSMTIRWIGRHTYERTESALSASAMPIRVVKDAIADGVPKRDLYLSPGHALLIDGMLIRVQDLVNGTSIRASAPADLQRLEYFHILLDSHEAVLAEGAAAETFLLEENSLEVFSNYADYARLYPGQQNIVMKPFAPVVGYGGREHLEALLRLYVPKYFPVRTPIQAAYERIAAQGERIAA